MLLHQPFDFSKSIVLDIANNHFGSVSHAIDLIQTFSELSPPQEYKVYFKLQFRDLDTFIHPAAPTDSHYVKRFNSTKLSKDELFQIALFIKDLPDDKFGLMVTPFDETSVSWAVDCKSDILKVASCSANDWPLLNAITNEDLPIVASTGGLGWAQIDNLVSYLRHQASEFALMHCISVYPTQPSDCQLSMIYSLIQRFPDLYVGWSTHEPPQDTDVVIAALTAGASLLERHICLPKSDKPQNAYSSTPDQLQEWYFKIIQTESMLHIPADFNRSEEILAINKLARGAYAKRNIKEGDLINREDVYYAFPVLEDGQLTASSIKYPLTAISDITTNHSLSFSTVSPPSHDPNIYLKEAIHDIKAILAKASIRLNSTFDLELSHHLGKEMFRKVGTTIITCINREYCKKLLIQLPGQKHPLHFHPRKEETFQVLYGSLDIISDTHNYKLNEGDILTVLPGVWHAFGSSEGCVFEEVSTTHYNSDSVYKDKKIASLTRTQRKTTVDHWGRFQMSQND